MECSAAPRHLIHGQASLYEFSSNSLLLQLVGVARGCAGGRRGRERTHLLLIYPALVQAVALQEPRLREMVRDVLQLAGAELGLGVAASPRAE